MRLIGVPRRGKPVPKFRIVEIGKLDGGYAIKVEVIEALKE